MAKREGIDDVIRMAVRVSERLRKDGVVRGQSGQPMRAGRLP